MNLLNADSHVEFKWYNEPPKFTRENGTLVIHTAEKTDFWQKTNYGFALDNGHLYYIDRQGDFTATCHIKYDMEKTFEQAGLMIYYNSDFWIKLTGEKDDDGVYGIGGVVTNHGYSDWSIIAKKDKHIDMDWKMVKKGNDFTIFYKDNEHKEWTKIRITHLHVDPNSPFKIGILGCSPLTADAVVTCTSFTVSDS